jgi:hypothetical protein
MLNIFDQRVRDVPVRPVYNIGERSGIRIWNVGPKLTWLLVQCFFWRMKEKYIIRDFHPLVFFYLLAISLFLFSIPLAARLFYLWWLNARIPPINALALMFTVIAGLQSLFFAMWFDMSYNKELR